MYKLRQICLLLLSLGVLLLGAGLPTLAARLQDARAENVVSYQNISSLELDLHDPKKLGLIEKCSLCVHGKEVMIAEEDAKHTRNEIQEIVRNSLEKYRDAGLIAGNLDTFSYDIDLMEVYSGILVGESAIFWGVRMTDDSDDHWQEIVLLLDDDQGAILNISYYENQALLPWDEEGQRLLMDAFFDIYTASYDSQLFTGGNVLIEENYDYGHLPQQEVCYKWGDLVYGETTLSFTVHPNGFSTNIQNTYDGSYWDEAVHSTVGPEMQGRQYAQIGAGKHML